VHLLLVEDDPSVAHGVAAGLRLHGFTVDHAETAAAAQAALAASEFDLAVLDLGLPDGDGMDLLARWRARGIGMPLLVLTARDAVSDRVRGLQAGADDYLLKPFDLDELVARLNALWRRRAGEHERVLRCGALSYDTEAGAPYLDDVPLDLTPRENALLRALIRTPGHAVARDQLCRLVFDGEEAAHGDAIDVVVHRLRKKLAPSGAEVLTLRGVGYLLRDKVVEAAAAKAGTRAWPR
jgi:two-component system response regulator TctD